MKKESLEVLKTGDTSLDRFAAAVKQNLDQITGQTKNARRMEPLPANATQAQIVERLNEIADRLQ